MQRRWYGIFCENNNKIGTSTQFVNKPIHYLFTAFNVISIAFFLHFSLKLVCSMKIDDCLQILSKVICVSSKVDCYLWYLAFLKNLIPESIEIRSFHNL